MKNTPPPPPIEIHIKRKTKGIVHLFQNTPITPRIPTYR